jgi:DNA-binding CsgD family transcriptional regulator
MDSSKGEFLQLLTTASQYSAPDFQRNALEILREACEFDAAVWGVVTFARNQRTIYHSIALHDLPPGVVQEFGAVAYTDGVADQVLNRPGTDVAAFNINEQLTSARHRDFLAYTRRFELNNLLYATRPHAMPGAMSFIALWRSSDRARYGEQDVAANRELLRCTVLAGVINDNLSFKAATTIPADSGFVRARASRSGVMLSFDGGFVELLRQQWPRYRGPMLPSDLMRALRDSPHRKFLGKYLIASALEVGDTLYILACPNTRRVELTPRQFEVASLVANGCSNKEVACRLSSSEKTVANHLSAIYGNLGLNGARPLLADDNRENWKRAALIRWWMEHPRGAGPLPGPAASVSAARPAVHHGYTSNSRSE